MRNLCVLLLAAAKPRAVPGSPVECRLRVMPWEVGVTTFRSDRYFAAAETAQFDFVARAGLLARLWRDHVAWINLEQSARFERPLKLLQAYTVTTRVEPPDGRIACFSHRFTSDKGVHAEVRVRAKFKSGRVTLDPADVLGRGWWPAAGEPPATRGP